MNHVTALLLDLTNIVGGFLLAGVLLSDLPRVGRWVGRAAALVARSTLVVGVLALVMGGYYVILHLTSGPHVFHFELVGIGVGVATLRDRLFPRSAPSPTASAAGPTPPAAGHGALFTPSPATTPIAAAGTPPPASGGALLLAVFGLIAIVVGIQGLLTPDG